MQHYIRIYSVIKNAGMFAPDANILAAIALVMRYRIKTEIIGNWLYCFTNALIGFQLEASGFWYSYKHCAYVYSGKEKECPADYETLDEIRARLGSRQLTGGHYGKNI